MKNTNYVVIFSKFVFFILVSMIYALDKQLFEKNRDTILYR